MQRIAFVFPGQGSQYVGMGLELYRQEEMVRELFSRADDVLGIKLSRICFEGPEEELQLTVNAQPAILTVSVAYLMLLQRAGVRPAVAAGHSLGEYTALVAAGALAFEDAVRLVRLRGMYMQEAVPPGRGGMLAVIGLEREVVDEICRKCSTEGVVEAVNYNCPGQVVVAGENSALEKVEEVVGQMGAARCVRLGVSAPFHSSLMKPAGEKLAAALEEIEIKDPVIPVVANVSADYVKSAVEIRTALAKQVYSPVRWEEIVNRLIQDGYGVYVEVGPGRVLSGLIRKTNRQVAVFSVDGPGGMEKVLARFREVD